MHNLLNVGTTYLSANQAAVRAGLTRDEFDQLCDAGKGPAIGIRGDAGEHFYLPSVVDAWMTAPQTEPADGVEITVEDEGSAVLDIAV